MARERRLCCALACYVLAGLAPATTAGAADSNRPRSAAPRPACPDSEAVWSTVTGLVPSAAARLLAAQPRVEIVDLGERYRVRVTTEEGVLERTYVDPERDCEKRRRFVAEFIVLSLLPPELAMEPSATPVPSSAPAPSTVPAPSATSPPSPTVASSDNPSAAAAPASVPGASPVPVPPTPVPPVSSPSPAGSSARVLVRPPSARRTGPAFARVELSALGESSLPVVGAPGFLAWVADLRARFGAGRWAAIAGVGYAPRAEFVASGVRGSVTRVPAIVGARARALDRPFELSGDFGLAVAFERYDGLSPHDPSGASRIAPGLEAGLAVSTHGLVGFAPFLALRIDWLPIVEELAAAPQGRLGNTPSLWIGVALGMSWEP